MHYAELEPDARLRTHLVYWRLTGPDEEPRETEPVLPDGRVEIVVHLGDPFRVEEDGRVVEQPRVLLAGPGTRPVRLAPTGRVDVIGVRLEAGAAAPLLEVPLEALVDRIPALDEVAGGWARGLAQELAEPRRGERWTAALDRRLCAALGEPDARVARAVARVRASAGQTTVDELAQAVGLSPRQLERRFRAEVGLGPKMFARLARFQHAWRLVERAPRATLASVAARAGYYDQAHLVRDFRQFAGAPPSRFLAAEHELARQFAS